MKDDNLPRSSWKFGKIVRLIISRDSKIRSAEVQLPGHSIITRSISHLYPMELPEKADKSVEGLDETDVREKSVSEQNTIEPVEDRRSKQPRKASIQARKAIQTYLNDNFTTNLFCFPREC